MMCGQTETTLSIKMIILLKKRRTDWWRLIKDIYASMPSANMQILTAAEQQFIRGATSEEAQRRKLWRKKQ